MILCHCPKPSKQQRAANQIATAYLPTYRQIHTSVFNVAPMHVVYMQSPKAAVDNDDDDDDTWHSHWK